MPEDTALAELKKGLQWQTGVKDVRAEFVPDGLNLDDEVVFQYHLFLVRLVPGGRRETVRLELQKFFGEEAKRLGLKNVRMEIDWLEALVFDPPV